MALAGPKLRYYHTSVRNTKAGIKWPFWGRRRPLFRDLALRLGYGSAPKWGKAHAPPALGAWYGRLKQRLERALRRGYAVGKSALRRGQAMRLGPVAARSRGAAEARCGGVMLWGVVTRCGVATGARL